MATTKQKIAASKMGVYGGNMGKAMIAAGYSHITAKTPAKLTKSKGWKELMDKYLPEEELTKLHKSLMMATRIQVYNKKAHTVPDNDVRLRALELGYKLRNKTKLVIEASDPLRNLSDDELLKMAGVSTPMHD